MSETPGGPEYYTPQPQAAPAHAVQPKAPQGLAITALVLGLVALFTGLIPVWGIVVGLVAIALGAVALGKKQSKGMAITGIVTGAIGVVISAVVLVVAVVLPFYIGDRSDPADWFTYSPVPTSGYVGDGVPLGPESVDGGLSVESYSYGTTTWDDTIGWYVVILDNPADAPYPGAQFTVNALDPGGATVDSGWAYATLPSGRSAITGFFYELGGAEMDGLEILGPTSDGLASAPAGGVLATVESSTDSGDAFTTVSGTVSSSFPDAVMDATGVVVATLPDGTIIDAVQTWVDEVPPGGTAPFEATFFDALPEGTTYEVYWTTY